MKWAGYNFYEPKDITDILSQTLWFNSYIKNNKKEMLFFSSWYSEGLFRVKDLFINNKIASYFEITRQYPNANINFLKYHSLISMLPQSWKRIVNVYFSNTLNYMPSILYNKLDKLLKYKKICATVVSQMRENMTAFPSAAFSKWQDNLNLQMEQEQFLYLFQNMYMLTKDSKLLIFQYKLLHRNTITNRNLNLWDQKLEPDLRRSDKCQFCNLATEYIEHLFYNCQVVKQFWTQIFQWISTKTNLNINFTIAEILLGGAPHDLQIFNLIFLLAKKYIYDCKCLKDKLNIFVFKYRVQQYFEAEKIIAFDTNKIERFNSKWDLIKECFLST